MAAHSFGLGRAKWTASSTTVIDVELRPRVRCMVDLAIKKPAGSVLTVKKKYGDGADPDQIVSADATSGTSVEVTDIRMMPGDELQVDIDATNGDKIVSVQAWRLT